MGFRCGAFATCWEVKQGKGNWADVRLSIGRKNNQGGFDQDFGAFCMFIGTANAKAERLKPKTRIKLKDIDVSVKYNKDQGREYVNYKVFDFDFADELEGDSGNARAQTPPDEASEDEAFDTPF